MTKFNDFNFNKNILETFSRLGFEKPTDIQKGSFKTLLTKKDFFGIAQTGGGKTIAFTAPMIEHLSAVKGKPKSGMPKALILAPTRELAQQISNCIRDFTKDTPIKHIAIYGGTSYAPQISTLKRGVDIVVGTPGRIMDHIGRGNISFDEISMFILDEADRMLDMGFLNDVKEISGLLSKNHQTMLFSATASKQIRGLVKGLLKDYDTVEIVGQSALPEKIDHRLVYLKVSNKDNLLLDILNDKTMEQAVVFVRTKHQADKIYKKFDKLGFSVDAIHGDKKQNARTRILDKFRNGKIKVLFATDVVARGIDVESITHVINYNMPLDTENYVHRVGRTGRAGRSGIAWSFVDGGDLDLLIEIEKFIGMQITVDNKTDYSITEDELENLPNPKTRGRVKGRAGFSNSNNRNSNNKPKRNNNKKKSFKSDQKSNFRKSDKGEKTKGEAEQKTNFEKTINVKSKRKNQINKKKSNSTLNKHKNKKTGLGANKKPNRGNEVRKRK